MVVKLFSVIKMKNQKVRNKILDLIKEKNEIFPISKISQELNIPKPVLYYHIKILEKNGKIIVQKMGTMKVVKINEM